MMIFLTHFLELTHCRCTSLHKFEICVMSSHFNKDDCDLSNSLQSRCYQRADIKKSICRPRLSLKMSQPSWPDHTIYLYQCPNNTRGRKKKHTSLEEQFG